MNENLIIEKLRKLDFLINNYWWDQNRVFSETSHSNRDEALELIKDLKKEVKNYRKEPSLRTMRKKVPSDFIAKYFKHFGENLQIKNYGISTKPLVSSDGK